MARQIVTTYVCDICATPIGTVPITESFGFDGIVYEIDLCEKHRDEFLSFVDAYREAGSRIGRYSARSASPSKSSRASAGAPASGPARDVEAVRSWARQQGMTVSRRGRIALTVLSAYDAAHDASS